MLDALTSFAEKLLLHSRASWNARRGQPIDFVYKGRRYYLNPDRSAPYAIQVSMSKLAALVAQIEAEPGVTFDVGANCGLFSALVGQRFPSCRVVCFEPSQDLIPLIRRNCSGMRVEICDYAISDRNETRTLLVDTDSQQNNSFSQQAVSLFSKPGGVEQREVSCRTLDSVASELSIASVDVLKVDVQGWEGPVFKGGRTILPQVKYLFVESTWMDVASVSNLIPFALHYGFEYATVLNPVHLGADILLTRHRVAVGDHLQFRLTEGLLKSTWY